MSPAPAGEALAIFTAGFSDLPLATFLNNLRMHGVQVLADVRSRPCSRRAPQFAKARLAAAAGEAQLRYLYLGRELGGLPRDAGLYDADGFVRYDRIAATPAFQAGVRRLLDELEQGWRIALCCGEADPRRCHRRLLIGRVLREHGVGMAHILTDGGLVAESELLDAEGDRPGRLTLFGDASEPEWKSVRAFPAKSGLTARF